MSNDPSRISIYELNHPKDTEDPRLVRLPEDVQSLKQRHQNASLIGSILFTADDHLIIDGNTRVKALKKLHEETGNHEYLHILDEYQGYVYAVPETDVNLDPQEAASELNTFRRNLSQAERAVYLYNLGQLRIVDEYDIAGDITKILGILHNCRTRGDEWSYPDDAKDSLKRLLASMGFNSPSNAKNYIETYQEIPKPVQREWAAERITESHARELKSIYQKIEDGAEFSALDVNRTDLRGYDNVNDYSKFAAIASRDIEYVLDHCNAAEYQHDDSEPYYTKYDLRFIADALQQALDDKSLLDAIGASEEQQEDLGELADEYGSSTESFVESNILEEDDPDPTEVEEFDEEELTEKIEDEKEKVEGSEPWEEAATSRTTADRWDIRGQAFEEFTEADWADSYAEPAEYHAAPPLVEENIQVFFHDSANTGTDDNYSGSMGDEIADESVDLFFFSPPYYVQRATIDTYDSYDDYLADMRKVFSEVYAKLKPHRYFLLNISDHTTTGGEGDEAGKRLPIQSDVSSMISREIGFEYEGTISWFKPATTTSQRAGHFFEREATKGQPLYYYPEDRIEEIFIFRKGERDQDAVYEEAMARFDGQFDDAEALRSAVGCENPEKAFRQAFTNKVGLDTFSGVYKTDLWPIQPTASKQGVTTHTAGYPKRLAKLVVQLYSMPGDRIADPMVGFGSTLAAVQDLNRKSEFSVSREGLGWESFVGEQEDQPDYYEVLQRTLGTTGIDEFLSPA